jgi:hypothetical protein
VQIKAQGLFNAAKWVETEYGQPALRDVLRECSPAVRERYTSAIVINWHPVEEFVEFLEVTEKLLGRGDGRTAEMVGAAGARENLRGAIARAALFLANPEFMMKRVSSLWSQFNDEGSMEMTKFLPNEMTIEVKGVAKPHWLHCCTITGWAAEVAAHFGWRSPAAKHPRCRAKGDTRCIWEIRGELPDEPSSKRNSKV